MERLDTISTKNYTPTVIYADDLSEIIRALSGCCSKVELIADNIRYEDVNEFIKESKGQEPNRVKIAASSPYIVVELTRMESSCTIISNQATALGVYAQINNAISKCVRWPPPLYGYFIPLIAAIASDPFLSLLGMSKQLAQYISILPFSWFIYTQYLNLRRHSMVIPLYRHERPSFWKANSDKLIVALFSAVLGAALALSGQFAMRYLDTSGFFAKDQARHFEQPIQPEQPRPPVQPAHPVD